ncbi:MAG: branched-chain amino acid ABC transporter permease [Oscillibacter sp.]|jgi:branched-chain amino acid transport system permease protein|nr:branched-chain amino acid ABC transporter permease [Oscillibacter sp.]
MKKNNKTKIVSAVLIVALLAVLLLLDNTKGVPSMLLTVLRKGAIYALVAVSMNLLNGFTGLFSLGQAGFMLLGAYTYAALTIPVESQTSIYQQYPGGGVGFSITEGLTNAMGGFGLLLGVVICLILAGIVAALLAYVIGLPVLRLKSDYLAIATLGFAEILRAVVQYAKLGPVTNGSNLLYGFTSFDDFKIGSLKLSTVMPFVFSGLCIAVVVLLINSTYGRAFKAIRDDEVAAEAMGINLAKHKRMSFVISSFFAGISGALLAMYQASVQAVTFKAAMTYEILLIVVIGGIGSISGSVIASFLFVGCSEWWLRFLDNEKTLKNFNAKLIFAIIFGLIVAGIAVAIFFKQKKNGKLGANVPCIGTAIVALAAIGWDIWFVISPNLKLPLLRSGFRMVVFSVIIMVVVLFFRKGLLGDQELPDVLHRFGAWLQSRFGKSAKGGDAK